MPTNFYATFHTDIEDAIPHGLLIFIFNKKIGPSLRDQDGADSSEKSRGLTIARQLTTSRDISSLLARVDCGEPDLAKNSIQSSLLIMNFWRLAKKSIIMSPS